MAKRRNQIVHHADLHDEQSEKVSPWSLADEWQLIQWHLAALAFHHRLRKATGPTNIVEERARQNVDNALIQNAKLGRALIEFTTLRPEQLKEGSTKLLEHVTKLRETLKLEIGMFLGPDGKPIEGTD